MSRSSTYLAGALCSGVPMHATVSGMSMWPALSPGDVVAIDPVARGRIPRPGDIVALRGEAGVVVHRIIHTAGGRLVTWGDNATAGDRPRDESELLGIVRPFRPRRWLRWLRQTNATPKS